MPDLKWTRDQWEEWFDKEPHIKIFPTILKIPNLTKNDVFLLCYLIEGVLNLKNENQNCNQDSWFSFDRKSSSKKLNTPKRTQECSISNLTKIGILETNHHQLRNKTIYRINFKKILELSVDPKGEFSYD